MSVLPACMYMYHMHACCLQRLEEGVRSCGTGVKDGCGPPKSVQVLYKISKSLNYQTSSAAHNF